MIKLLVLADDFTGALDTGVQFSKMGATVQVTTDSCLDLGQVASDIDVLVIDTESRYLESQAAYKLIKELTLAVKAVGIPYLYKKVDSALRGNISSEIKAIWDVHSDRGLAFVPAFPAVHRTVNQGILYIDGVPVADSVFGIDPYEPVTESNILKRLEEEADLDFSLVNAYSSLGAGVPYLFDASTDADLDTIGQLLRDEQLLSVTVGCAGFATVLAGLLFGEEALPDVAIAHPITVICGSVNPITQDQVARAKAADMPVHSLLAQQLLEEDYWTSAAGEAALQTYLESMGQSDLVVFETFSQETTDSIETYRKKEPLEWETIRFRIGTSLGRLAKRLMTAQPDRTFLFTGGDTLYQSMQVLGVTSIRPLLEISPGVVLSQLELDGKTIQVMTKSGGFGQPDLMIDLVNKIQKKEFTC